MAHTLAQLAIPALALIGFGRLFLADDESAHGLAFALIAVGFAGKIWLSI